MINYFFTNSWKSLLKNKSFLVLNTIGLALGITSCLMIFLVIRYELSFDKFHKKADHIYRITTTICREGTDYFQGASFPVGGTMKEEFPEVEKVATVSFENNGIIKANDQVYREKGIAYISPDFFDLFDFEWMVGSPAQSLTAPASVVLTESVACRYFGIEKGDDMTNAMGKIIRLNNRLDFTVTGVTKDFPSNTDLPFSIMLSLSTMKPAERSIMTDWVALDKSISHFVLLRHGVDPQKINARLPDFLKKYLPADEAGRRIIQLQPLNKIHFDNRFGTYNNRTVTYSTILMLSLIGIFLLATACINFINLATAQSANRSKEVGIHKALGARKVELVRKFMGEAVLVTLIAVVMSFVVAFVSFSSVSGLLGVNINPKWVSDPLVPAFFIGITLAVSILTGLYPALIMSGFQPILALTSKINNQTTHRSFSLRRGLVIFQFVLSQVLIISTIVVLRQLDFFQKQPLGFNKDAVITVSLLSGELSQKQTLRNRFLEVPGVQSVSFCRYNPSSLNNWYGVFNFQGSGIKDITVLMLPVDQDYLKTYGLTLLAGRNIVETDGLENGIIVNEKILKTMNIANPQDAIGKPITVFDNKTTIVGVVKDFHALTLHQEIPPVLLFNDPSRVRLAAIKMSSSDLKNTITKIESVYKSSFPDNVFEYQFLDQTIASFYQEERKLSHIFSIFSGIAILTGCLGLFGLISCITTQRKKEIGIRKVNGARLPEIITLLNKDLSLWIFIAFVIATPIAYYAMNKWLENFAYKTELSWWIFALAGLLALGIALLTVSWQSWKAATKNPVEALRYE